MKHVAEIDHTKMHFMEAGDDMLQITSPLNQFGIEYVGFSRVNQNHEESFLTSRIDSAHIWYQGKFYENLFCDDISKYSDTNVLWDQLADHNMHAANLFNTFSENADIAHGISMVRKYETYVDHFYFAGKRSNVNLSQFFLNNLDILDAFIPYFYDKANQLIIEAEANRVYTPGCQDTSLLTTQSVSILRRSKVDFMAQLYDLSVREADCLDCLTECHTAKEIAAKLFISSRTVEKHLKSIRSKMRCSSISELISKLC